MALGTPQEVAAAVVGIATTNTVSANTNVAINTGDLVIVVVASNTINRVLNTISDGSANAYTVNDAIAHDATNDENIWIGSCYASVSRPIGTTFTATFASSLSSVRGIWILRVTGAAPSGFLDRSAVNTGTSSSPTATDTGPTSQPNELLIGAVWMATSPTTASPGLNKIGGNAYNELSAEISSNARTFDVEWYITSTADTYRAAFNMGAGGARWRCAYVSYKELSIQRLRPDADISATGWSTAPLFSKINEVTADGVVISGTAS